MPLQKSATNWVLIFNPPAGVISVLFPTGIVCPWDAGSNRRSPQFKPASVAPLVNLPQEVISMGVLLRSDPETIPNILSVIAPGPAFTKFPTWVESPRLSLSRRACAVPSKSIDAGFDVVPPQEPSVCLDPPTQGLNPGLPFVPFDRRSVNWVLILKSTACTSVAANTNPPPSRRSAVADIFFKVFIFASKL